MGMVFKMMNVIMMSICALIIGLCFVPLILIAFLVGLVSFAAERIYKRGAV